MSENKKPSISLEFCAGDYTKGDPYPEHDFTELEKHGVVNKAGVVACSNKELIQQIDVALKDKPLGTTIKYFYYKVNNER